MKLILGISVLVVLLIGLLASLPFLVDLARYQEQYKPLVEAALNRKIDIQGIRLTIWPRIGARVRGFTVLDDPAFSSTAFAALASLDVGIKWRPLLSGNVEVEEIILREPTINVVKNKNGIVNVSTIGPPSTAPSPKPQEEPVREPLQALALLAVDRVAIEGGRLAYRDLSVNPPAEYLVQDLQLTLRAVRLGESPSLHASATVQPPNIPVTLDGTFGPLVQTVEIQQYGFQLGIGKVTLHAKGSLTGGKLSTVISSPLIHTADLPVRLPLTKPVQIKDLLVAAAAPYPLKHGAPPLEMGEISNLTFAVALGNSLADVKGSLLGGHAKATLVCPSLSTADLPVETGLTVPISIQNIQASADLKGQEARLSDLSFQVFGGRVKASGALRTGAPAAPFNGTLAAQGVQVAPALAVLRPDAKVTLSGTAAADIALAGRGFKMSDLTDALEGSGHVEIKNGKVEGTNVLEEAVGLLKVAGLSLDHTTYTAFSTAETDFSVKKGIVQVQRLLLDNPDFQATGVGTVGFDQKLNLAVNLNLSPVVSQKIAGSSGLGKLMLKEGRLRLPLLITGTAQDPSYGVDMKSLTSGVQQHVEERARQAVKGLLEGTTKPEDLKKQGTELLRDLLRR